MNNTGYNFASLSESEIEIINKAQNEIAQKGSNVVLIAYDHKNS